MPDDSAASRADPTGRAGSIESRASWFVAGATLAILSISYGAPLLIVVGLKPMEADLGLNRSVLALAAALVWIGTGAGGIGMGWLADRIGIRAIVLFGSVMIAAGLALSATGRLWAIYVGHGVLMGLLGMGAIYPPLVTYVSRWFDRRRGTAVALISSGQYVAGVVWPAAFQFMIGRTGWRLTMLVYAAVVVAIILPVAAVSLHPPPVPRVLVAPSRHAGRDRARVLGLPANVVQTLICAAGFCCCVPMAIPSSHLVAYCSDLGIGAESGAAMLSLLLGCAFISRQFWGVIADRYGGLWTVLAGSACQAIAIAAFLLTQNEVALYAIAAAYGLGFSGIIPAYVVAIRELFPAAEASWRIPLVLFISMGGMAFGSWFAGSIYDRFGHYGPAFGVGVLFNLANLTLIGFLLTRQPRDGGRLATA